jgi:hypothetical protein
MNNVKSMLESVERIFQSVESVVGGMEDGKRIQIKELTHTVSMAVGMEDKQVLPFVNHYVHNTDSVYVTRGKYGGIIKGKKPVKPTSQA